MGLDGGTIISRSDVVRGQSWRVAQSDAGAARSTRGGQLSGNFVAQKEALSEKDATVARLTCCALTGDALRRPVVACELGRLYNKGAVVEWALGRKGAFASEEHRWRYHNQLASEAAAECVHLRSLKDVFEVHPFDDRTANPRRSGGDASCGRPAGRQTNASGGSSIGGGDGALAPAAEFRIVCPVTGARPSHLNTFSAVKPCGHLLSDKALKQCSSGGDGAPSTTCLQCGVPYHAPHELIPLARSQRVVDALRATLLKHRSLAESTKKQKKKRSDTGGHKRKRAEGDCAPPRS
mmetsp:Transcript_1658/g.5819  ORF Transcript_1658/g.5819 Transcript_1658/m.5819 type:complete len:294 (+) Transcript_1658:174-1055(+)